MTCPTCMASAPPCPCGTVVHPWVVFNPPNQPAIRYRAGDYAAFRHALLRALPEETELTQTIDGATIQVWRPGAQGDLAVQMIEWWAYLSDVLTFYNERLATQAYLSVADLPESVNRLIQILGYRPRPGIGSSVTLAALLNTLKPVTLPQGFKVQSKPGPGQKPQVFELGSATVVQKPDRVSARTVPTSAPLLSLDGTTVWLAGQGSGVKAGDQLLMVNAGAVSGGTVEAFAWATVSATNPKNDAYGEQVTAVIFTTAVEGIPSGAAASEFALLRSLQSTPPWSSRPTGWTTPVIGANGIDLASISRNLSAGTLALLDVKGSPSDASVVPTLTTVVNYSEVVWFANGNGVSPPAAGAAPPIPIPHTHLDFSSTLSAAWDANASLVTVRFDWRSVGQLVGVSSADDAAFTAKSVLLATDSSFPTGVDLPVLLQDSAGNGAASVGTASADGTTMTLGSVTSISAAGLGSTLDVLFDLFTVSRGETVANEVLGNGNTAVASQDFQLKKSPVTYFTDPASLSGDQFSSTVQIWVNGLRWTEVPTFFGQPPNAAVFTTREDEQGNTHVVFGDDVNGARLPTGVNNVLATYRTGSGADAPSSGTLTNILQPQPGLTSLANPLAPTGGADPEASSKIGMLAPRSVLTFNRAISLDDYKVIAASTPGVVQAEAAYRFDPIAQRPCVTVWVSGDAGAVAAVKSSIAAEADPNRPISVLAATGVDTVINFTYLRDSHYLDDTVRSALHRALLDPDTGLFGVNVVGIGQVFYDSQIYAACLAVPGVVAVEDLSVQAGARFAPFFALGRIQRGIIPINAKIPCTGQRYDPGIGRYLSVPDDGNHLSMQPGVAS
jgi:hypothetical protein